MGLRRSLRRRRYNSRRFATARPATAELVGIVLALCAVTLVVVLVVRRGA